MFDFHKDKQRYFNIQKAVTEEDVIPFLEKQIGSCINKRVLEVGCAEAGVLKAFLDKGNTGIGIELAESRFVLARQFLDEDIKQGKADIINKNIYDVKDPASELNGLFDIIILKDVIEHIHDQGKFIQLLRGFLAPDGVVFFAYPPWWMPFGAISRFVMLNCLGHCLGFTYCQSRYTKVCYNYLTNVLQPLPIYWK
ncbi:MAG: class I SAM-dependent methyltransferase [Saprospiraceae bacterium]|nr:class I SAM-dependent methyltransferase [Saprospiraceae bacterium]